MRPSPSTPRRPGASARRASLRQSEGGGRSSANSNRASSRSGANLRWRAVDAFVIGLSCSVLGQQKKHSRRRAASMRHRAWAACDRAWRKYSCGHPNTPRGAGSSVYFQDVTHGHFCVQSRSHFSLRLPAFAVWLGSLDDRVSVNIACCRSSIDCLCTGAFAGRSSGRRTPSKHPAASR